jgi:excisionase family DNA binding protein
MTSKDIVEPLVYNVPTVGKLLHISRATAYSLCARNVIPTIRLGRRLVVSKAALDQMLSTSVNKNKR